jgi:hypothetical protein
VCVGLNDGSSVVVGGSVVGASVGVIVGLGEGFSVGDSVNGAGVALIGVPVGAPVVSMHQYPPPLQYCFGMHRSAAQVLPSQVSPPALVQ